MWTFCALLLLGLPVVAAVPDSGADAGLEIAAVPEAERLTEVEVPPELASITRANLALDALIPLLLTTPATPEEATRLEEARQQLFAAAPLPILVQVLERRTVLLEDRRRVAESARTLRHSGSGPRKRNLNPDTLSLMPESHARSELEEIQKLEGVHARLFGELGDRAHASGLLTSAFRAYARALVMAPDILSQVNGRDVRYLDAATFMVLSAHQSDDVLALYRRLPLDRAPLDRAIIAQIDRWLNLYAQAPEDLTSFSGIQQALGDLLFVLIEDPASAEVLPDQERRRLLNRLATAALERHHYAEAVGAYARLGDTKALQRLGRQLSKAVLIETHQMLLVQREIDLAIDALAEAGDTVALRELLAACLEARERIRRGDKPAVNHESLDRYIRHLDSLVGEGKADGKVLASRSASPATQAVPDEKSRALTDERLAELIDFYRSKNLSALGEDRREANEMLKQLEAEAAGRNRLELAVKAATARDNAGLELVKLGDRCVDARQWALALDAYRAAGSQGMGGLRLLGERLTHNEPIVRGDALNPVIPIAIEAFLAADAVDRLEPLYGSLVASRSDLARLGEAGKEGLSALDALIRRIEDTYEMVPSVTKEVTAAVEKPAPKKAAPAGKSTKGKKKAAK